jgi:hypothetical protein
MAHSAISDGRTIERHSGTPQGGVISPVLANLFLHYAFDAWMVRNCPQNPWVRYADDAVIHCRTREGAKNLLERLNRRFGECLLELHPHNKTTGSTAGQRFQGLFAPRGTASTSERILLLISSPCHGLIFQQKGRAVTPPYRGRNDDQGHCSQLFKEQKFQENGIFR